MPRIGSRAVHPPRNDGPFVRVGVDLRSSIGSWAGAKIEGMDVGIEPSPTVRARRLEVATIAWNLMEFFVTIALGVAAGSLALVAFGLDSIAEVVASVATIWSLQHEDPARLRRSLRLVSFAFFLLAAVLLTGGIRNLAVGHRPDVSVAGMVYLGITALAMFGLAIAKRRVSRETTNHTLVHETRVTFLDGGLATLVLAALVIDAAFGWWWADAAAAIVVGIAAIGEGVIAPREHADAG